MSINGLRRRPTRRSNTGGPLTILAATIPVQRVGTVGRIQLRATGGPDGPMVWDAVDPPAGVSISESGLMEIDIAVSGPEDVVARVHRGDQVDTHVFPFSAVDAFQFVTQGGPTIYVGETSTVPMETTGGVGTVRFVIDGAIPGMILHDNGDGTADFTGQATQIGPYSVKAEAFDSQNVAAWDAHGINRYLALVGNIVALPAISTKSIANPVIGIARRVKVATTGGVAPLTPAQVGTWPEGVTWDPADSEIVYGSGLVAGTFGNWGLRYTDAAGRAVEQRWSVTILPDLVKLTTDVGAVVGGVTVAKTIAFDGGQGAKHSVKTGGSAFVTLSDGGVATFTNPTPGPWTLAGTTTDDIDTLNWTLSGTVAAAPSAAFDNSWADGIGIVGRENVAAWDAWVGNNRSGVLITPPWTSTFAAVTDELAAGVTAFKNRNGRLDFHIPLASTSGAFTLATINAGTHDAALRTAFANIIANGRADSGLVIGQDFNVDENYIPWSAMGHEAEFIAAANRVASIAKSMAGQAFTTIWAPTTGPHGSRAAPTVQYDPAAAWPGGQYFDAVGINMQARRWGTDRSVAGYWADIDVGIVGPSSLGGSRGLASITWAYDFAKVHDLKVALPMVNVSADYPDGSGVDDVKGSQLVDLLSTRINNFPDDVEVYGWAWAQQTGAILGDDSRPLTETEFAESVGFIDRTKLRWITSPPPAGKVGQAYSWTGLLDGGVGPYTYQFTGTLPHNVTRTNATLSGTPDQAGRFQGVLTATDSTPGTPQVATIVFDISIAASSGNYVGLNLGFWANESGYNGLNNFKAANGYDAVFGVRATDWTTQNCPNNGQYHNQVDTMEQVFLRAFDGVNAKHMVIGVKILMGGTGGQNWTYADLKNNTTPVSDGRATRTRLAHMDWFADQIIRIVLDWHARNPTKKFRLRLWEDNGDWYYGGFTGSNYQDYAWAVNRFFGRIRAGILSSNSSGWFKTEWDMTHGYQIKGVTMETVALLILAVVDVYGLDAYNEVGNFGIAAHLGNGVNDWLALHVLNFCIAHSKLTGYGEIGSGRKAGMSSWPGDNAAWLLAWFNWMNATVGALLDHVIWFDKNSLDAGQGDWNTSVLAKYWGTLPKPNLQTTIINALKAA